MIKAIIFDFDGVIAESTNIKNQLDELLEALSEEENFMVED